MGIQSIVGDGINTSFPIPIYTGLRRLGGRKHILYRGFYYDITDFIPRHPGGEGVIGFYVNNGEDASEAMDQFHFRSEKRVGTMLKSFKKRKATEEELISAVGDEEKFKKNVALTQDFASLFQQLKEEGLFEPSKTHIFLRLVELHVFAVLSLYFFLHGGYKVLGAAFMVFGAHRCIYFFHEAGHLSFTGKPWLDKLLQGGICGFYIGLSGATTRLHHNKHHAMPQHIHNDSDINPLPIMAFHKQVLRNWEQLGFLLKYQGFLAYVIQSNVLGLYWKFVEHPIFCWKNGCYWDLFWITLHNALFIPLLGPQWYYPIALIPITTFHINSSLNHSHLPVTQGTTHWVEYCLVHTANVTTSWWIDYYMGHSQYHIEHHLFPTMPEFKNRLASRRVKALAKKHALPYQVYDWWTMLGMAMDNFGKIAGN